MDVTGLYYPQTMTSTALQMSYLYRSSGLFYSRFSVATPVSELPHEGGRLPYPVSCGANNCRKQKTRRTTKS